MDFIIRQHLSAAENQRDADALLKAFTLIKAANKDTCAKDGSEKFSPDLFILCAEQALQLGSPAVSKACLQMYFKNQPPPNQFLGRAFLCQAQLHNPKSSNDVGELEKSLAYYLKTIDFAKQQQRYHFLVYNASVLYLQTVRPFLKPGSRHLLLPSLLSIVKSLGEINDADKTWRADLKLELLECFLDAQKMKEAADCASMASEFIRVNAPQKYPVLFAKMVHHKLIDSAKAAKETKTSATLSVIYKMQKLRSQMDGSFTAKDVFTNLNEIYKLLATADDESAPRLSTSEKIPLLIELARLSMDLGCNPLAAACVADLEAAESADPKTLIAIESLQGDLQALQLGHQIDTYSKSVVETQLRVINRLETTLQNAVRLGEPITIQDVCAALWNHCLPLLQRNLRKHLKKPLLSLADSLESIDSLLTVMRCQIHLELAQIEEEDDRIEVATRHLEKALSLDGNGQYQNHLKSHLHRLQLRTALYTKPQRAEDQAAMIIEQGKQSSAKDSVGKKRSLLVNAGLRLAPDVFQMVLDSENEAKVSTGKSNKGRISYLCMKAQHHSKCFQKTDGHLQRMESTDDAERVRLWADLAKVARKQEVWDVCRAACRFCLLYDDGRWNVAKPDASQNKSPAPSAVDEGRNSELETSKPQVELFSDEKVLLRLLAEIRFINAEATIHFLKSEGCKLNESPVPPEDTSMRPSSYVPVNLAEDPEWIQYRDWILQLSAYATDNFLRAAELGVELQEAWITHNATVYILNHNKHIIASGRLTLLVETLQKLLGALKKTGHCGDPALLVLLSNALAKGFILRWIPVSDNNKRSDTSLHTEKGKKASGKGSEKSNAAHVLSVDPNGLPDVRLALEVCDYAFDLTNGRSPEDVVPIAIRQQLISSWVKAKQLLQQQIGPKLGTEDEDNNEGQNPMTRVLVALEMHSCNGLGLMDFTVPSLSQVHKTASECEWSDRQVELQALTRLAHFAYNAGDLELALSCTRRALTFEKKIRSSALTYEMFSVTACIQGQSIMDGLAGKKHLRLSAIKAFVMSSRFGGEAGSPSLTLQAAKHFWYACSPLIKSANDRGPLKDSVICVIKALAEAEVRQKKRSEHDAVLFHLWPSMDVQSRADQDPQNLQGTSSESDPSSQELSLKAALYELLFNIYADKNEWQSGLKVLDEAISILPRTRHRLVLFKHRVLAKARLGQNFFMDIQKFKDESEDYVSYIWHHVALSCKNTSDQLACYMNAIDALQKPENHWQKVEYLLELAEWLYCRQFPASSAVTLLDWAVDILLHMKITPSLEEGKSQKVKPKPKKKSFQNKEPAQDEDGNVDGGKPGAAENACSSLEDVRSVRQLEALARAFILMAVIGGRGSHEQSCLMAYSCVLRIWQVSLPAAGNLIKSLQRNPALHNPPSASSQKDKGKKEASESVVIKEKPKRKAPIDTVPSTAEEWAGYDCPDEIRDAFRQDTSSQVINRSTIVKPTYSLYYLDLLGRELQSISFPHLSLPVLQLAEVIAHDILQSKSLSDLYHLRISQVCTNLKWYHAVTYHQRAAGDECISEHELISCRLEISRLKNEKQDDNNLSGKRENPPVRNRQKILSVHTDGRGLGGLSLPYLWLEKADVLIDLGLFQPARVLLTQAYTSLQDIGDAHYQLKCVYLLSVLAIAEKNYGQAKSLLLEVNDLPRDAELWYKTTMTLTEAILGAKKEDGRNKASNLLESTIDVFRTMMQKETNREAEYGCLIAKLNSRKFSILLNNAQELMSKGTEPSQVIVLLLDMCDKASQIEADLLRYGHKEYRAELMMEHANILRILAQNVEDLERKHGYYLEAYGMAEQAISSVEQILYKIQSAAVMEAGGMSLPVQRKLTKMKLDFAELSLEIIQLVIEEEDEKWKEEKRKGELRVIVEEFVRATPDYNSVGQEWETLGRTVASAALSQLANALALAGGCDDVKARALYITGKCLHLLSNRIDPLHPDMYWNDHYLDERKTSETSGDNGTEWHHANRQPSSKQLDQLVKKAAALKTRRKLAQMYLAQSTEILLQTINVAINNSLMDILSSASLEICTCLGQFDSITAGVFLALHQSCVSSMMTQDLVLAATLNTSNSQFAALMHLHKYLQEKGDEGPLRKQVEQRLAATSRVWGNLQVTMQYFNIFNDLPANFNLVILQHSEDRSLLYGALLEKPKPVSTQKGKSTQQQRTLRARVARCSVDRHMLAGLLEKMELFRQDMMQRQLKKEHQESFTRRKISKEPAMNDPNTVEEASHRKLMEDFHDIVEVLETYLSPVLLQLDLSPFRQPSPPLSTTESVRAKSREKDDKPATTSSASVDAGDCLILLADRSLQQLPLEALGVFKDDGINSVSRDFSLQLLHNRIHRDHTEDAEGKRDVRSAKESKPRGEQKKNIKTVPINHVLPANCIPVDTHCFKYIVDPYNDIREPEALSPVYRMNEVLVKYSQQFTANWDGITGGSHVPSHGEWERLMTSCGAFIFYGTERLLAHILLDKFLAMDFTGCQLLILLDQVRTSQSFSRQSMVDVQKSESHLLLERPVETALMLSVAGVRSMMLNQWHTTLGQNAKRLDYLSECLLALGKTTGQTVHSQRKMASDSERHVREEDNPTDTQDEAGQSPRDSMPFLGDPSPYSYILYGLPNLVVA